MLTELTELCSCQGNEDGSVPKHPSHCDLLSAFEGGALPFLSTSTERIVVWGYGNTEHRPRKVMSLAEYVSQSVYYLD